MKLPDVRYERDLHRGTKLHEVVNAQKVDTFYSLGTSCHIKKDGSTFFVQVCSQYIFFQDKNAVSAFLMDDNERRVAEMEKKQLLEKTIAAKQQLPAHNERLKEIARLFSHGVRKPVATILGLAQLLTLENPIQQIQ